MPAGSDHAPTRQPPIKLPHTWRPLGVRLSGSVFGGALVAVAAIAWVSLPEEIQSRFTTFQRITMLVLCAVAFGAWLALVRSRVVADVERLTVVNGFRRREFDWAEVVSATLGRGAPWASLDLADGTTVPAMGIQGSDGARARAAIRQLSFLVRHPPTRSSPS
ncbi:MAG: PH domain-containing protein [Nocardioides sp.]